MGVIELARPFPFVAIEDRAARRPHVILPPGRIYASDEPVTVFATIGSGVAVCLWDEVAQVGGIAHYLLPTTSGWEHAIRCGAGAIPALIERVVGLGAVRDRLVAKIFGGARVIQSSDCAQGAMNIKTAVETLAAEGIEVAAADLGGNRARKLVFHIDDGRTWVKRL